MTEDIERGKVRGTSNKAEGEDDVAKQAGDLGPGLEGVKGIAEVIGGHPAGDGYTPPQGYRPPPGAAPKAI